MKDFLQKISDRLDELGYLPTGGSPGSIPCDKSLVTKHKAYERKSDGQRLILETIEGRLTGELADVRVYKEVSTTIIRVAYINAID